MSLASCCLFLLRQGSALSGADSSFHSPSIGSPRDLERKEAHPELDEPFDEAMILLDEIVEIFALAPCTGFGKDAFFL